MVNVHTGTFKPNQIMQEVKKDKMKKKSVLLGGLLVVVLLATVLGGCTAAQTAPQPALAATPEGLSRYITVIGKGEVSLIPDVAQINVGSEVIADTVSEAKAEVDRRMEAIMAVLEEMGIADEDIQTSHYSIYYEREPFYPMPREETSPETEGAYRVSNMLEVTIRDLEVVGEVLDAVVEAGANQMYGVTFTISDDQDWESEAREKAMADAKARAEELAGLAGVELGEVLSVSEVVGSPMGPVAIEMAAMGRGGGGIAPGELEFGTQIQVTFAIQ
jgi:uncharacterized protein YggE